MGFQETYDYYMIDYAGNFFIKKKIMIFDLKV